ncbi:hypothetical protein ACRAKG_40880 [Streptomyces rosealbus]
MLVAARASEAAAGREEPDTGGTGVSVLRVARCTSGPAADGWWRWSAAFSAAGAAAADEGLGPGTGGALGPVDDISVEGAAGVDALPPPSPEAAVPARSDAAAGAASRRATGRTRRCTAAAGASGALVRAGGRVVAGGTAAGADDTRMPRAGVGEGVAALGARDGVTAGVPLPSCTARERCTIRDSGSRPPELCASGRRGL